MDNFRLFIDMVNKLQSNLAMAYEHFLIRDSLKKSIASNIQWERKSKENVDIINKFIRFFWPSMEANRKIFALELAKFFDKDKKSLSLYKLINFVRSNIKSFDKDNFIEYIKNVDLWEGYEPIDENLLKEIENEISTNLDIIKKLKIFRDQNLAHNQQKKEMNPILVWEIDDLFKLTLKWLNKISEKTIRNTRWNLWSDNYTEQEVYSVLDWLKRFEPYRIKEIHRQSKKEIKYLSNLKK